MDFPVVIQLSVDFSPFSMVKYFLNCLFSPQRNKGIPERKSPGLTVTEKSGGIFVTQDTSQIHFHIMI